MVLFVGLKQEVHPVFACNGIIKVGGWYVNFEKAFQALWRSKVDLQVYFGGHG